MSATPPAPPSLPIDEVLADIVRALDGAGSVVVTAPPGAGKTTKVPLALIGRPWQEGRVLVLEPRRVAARAAALRMASTLGERLGGRVGLTTRDERKTSRATIVEVVTEGVLIRRLLREGDLPGVSAVIFDEFHERSLDADLGLSLCLELREVLRPDLRIAVLSATIDAQAVASLMDPPAEVVASQGRAFPVTVEHLDVPVLSGKRPRELAAVVAPAIAQAMQEHAGDVLVFLPGVREIDDVRSALGDVDADIVPLHGRLPPREQDRALLPGTRRRVVLATDLAESSVTVPGVRIVVDAGLAREPRLDPRLGMTRLVTVTASRASADQRAGRAGRVASGHAVRLWPASTSGARPAWPTPELAQGDLAGFLLSLAAWGLPAEQARLLDAPPGPAMQEARDSLRHLGAIDSDGRITSHGQRLSRLPMHPRLGHLLLLASEAGNPRLGAELAALLGERDIIAHNRDRPDADLISRLRKLRQGPRGGGGRSAGREQVAQRVRRDVKRLQRQLPDSAVDWATGSTVTDEEAQLAAVLLAMTWPDRIARRRGEQRGAFQLANGRGARLPEGDALAGESWLIVADVDAGMVDARIHRAVALDPEAFAGELAGLVVHEDVARWNDEHGEIEAMAHDRVGALVLRSRPLATAEVDLRPALVDAVRARGLGLLDWSASAMTFRGRVACLHGALGEPWPDVRDAVLLADLDAWLLHAIPRRARRLADLKKVDLTAALRGLVPASVTHRMAQLAPTHVAVPSGSRIRLEYGDAGPVLAVKVQEVFGWEASPTVADGRVPVRIHLLSPAGRPLQVTSDLAGFWDGAWKQVRSEMRGRYPKHAWPENPREVPAHRGTARRPRRG